MMDTPRTGDPRRPNILFLLPDQLRVDFLGCAGAGFVKTPHIDRIAGEGIRYENAYSVAPVCVPARASLLTGMNPIRNGVLDNSQWLRPDLAACGIRTWPQILSEAVYHTAAIGKMHFYPWDDSLGFQTRVIAEDKRWPHIADDYADHLERHGLRKLHGNEHEGYEENKGAIINRIPWEHSVDHFVGAEAARFIREYEDDRPFAMMVGFPGPHCPYDPNAEFLNLIDESAMPAAAPYVEANTARIRERSVQGNRRPWNGVDYTEFTEAQIRKVRAHYSALVNQIDVEVGRILEALEVTDQLENTVVLFSSDHGDYLGDHGLIGKGTFYEGSSHVPLLVRLPKSLGSEPARGTTVDDLVELSDITATILELAGCPVPGYCDSRPLPGLGLTDQPLRDHITGMNSGGWMLLKDGWKLCQYATGDIHLFHLAEDPQEQRNLADDPAQHARMLAMQRELTAEVLQSLKDAHLEKAVDLPNTLWSDPEYGRRGRERVYPKPRI